MGESRIESGDAGDSPRGDEAAEQRRFQALTLPHLDAAYNLARWLSRNPRDAEDIVQDAYLRALRFFGSFRGDSARPWLLAIVRRVWYDEWRRRISSEEAAEFDETRDDEPPEGWDKAVMDPETLAIRAEDAQRVHEALERLPATYREVMILREMEELSYREIATIVDVPVGTVMSRLARGRERLAALLGAQREPAARLAAVRPVLAQPGGGGATGETPGGPAGRREEPAGKGGAERGPGTDCNDVRSKEARDGL